MAEFKLIVGGQALETRDTFQVKNPATEDVVSVCPSATNDDLDLAVAAARAAFPAWSQTSHDERSKALLAIADEMEAKHQEIATLITQEQGRPLGAYQGMGSMFEVGVAISWLRATAGMELVPKVLSDDEKGRVVLYRKPVGVVASITPWNWPLMIAIWHIAPALTTGNTVIVKPSSLTPLSTMLFVEIANSVLPAGVLNVITGESGLGRHITAHPDIDKIVFTGSTPTGKNIMQNASVNLKRLTLELGGNDAGIVLPDVNVQDVASLIFKGAFSNNGQTCAALKRLYVHDDIYDEMCRALVDIAASVKVGNGLDEGVDFGPLQNQEQYEIVSSLVEDARTNGARILTGGNPDKTKPGYFYPITLVSEISDGTKLVDEEQFGPALPIIRYTDIDEVINRANDNPNGLGGSIWSKDLELAESLAKRLESGSAWVNAHGGLSPFIPFGGVKQSGFGVEFGLEGMEEYTNIQVVNVQA